jgi:hypothetical protein
MRPRDLLVALEERITRNTNSTLVWQNKNLTLAQIRKISAEIEDFLYLLESEALEAETGGVTV